MSRKRNRRWSASAVIGLFAVLLAVLPARAADPPQPAPESTRSDGWDLALTGGFVANGLTDPVWALGTIPGRPTRVVIRDTDRESSASLGIAMFAQVYNDRFRWIAPMSFGVGVRSDRPVFYLGPALRFGRHASFTAGVAVGSIAALPPGVHEHETVADTNVLSSLGARTTESWFAAVTYTFASIR